MPGKSDHEQAASENRKALDFLMTRIDDFPQWATIVAFYTALHVVEAVFSSEGHHSDDHKDRNRRLKTDRRFQHIWKHYRELWNDSLIARYLEDSDGHEHPVFSRYMPPEKVESVHVNHNLHQIIKSARQLLGDSGFVERDDASEPEAEEE